MSDFSAFKAMALGIVGMFAVVAVAPEAGGHYDLLRFKRTKLVKAPTTSLSPTPTTTTSPTPTAPTTTTLFPEETMIPSNFDINSELTPSWGTGGIANPSPDPNGSFRFICSAGQLLYDDPIVYPGQPGKSHLHQFFGNTSANAHSTYQSLRTSGQSTCMSPLNRSAYWMPAMLNGRGQVVRPDYVTIYYKRMPASDPSCDPAKSATAIGKCISSIPNGLKFIFGRNMQDMAAAPTGEFYFDCDGPGAVPGHYPDLVTAAKNCPAGARIGALITAPACWDGKNLDSPDHRSHVAYVRVVDSHTGRRACPSTHPYVIPEFALGAWYTVDETLDRSGIWEPGKTVTWHLSSDVMPGMAPAKPGTTFHTDWFGGWDNTVLAMWMDNCLNKKLSCAGGDLGNGKQMKTFSGFSWTANPRLVPVP
jgi:hypothetical protein